MELLPLLNAILLFLVTVPVIMKYRLLPIDGTPYWLFGIVFLLLFINICCAIFRKQLKKRLPIDRLRWGLTILVLGIVIGGVTWTAIVDRHQTAPVWGVHDIILQQEAAMRYLIQKKNPYKETYFGTLVEGFNYEELGRKAINPALYHFVMPPWYLIFPFAVYIPANHLFGFFDGRMVSLLLLALTGFIFFSWFRNRELGILTTILVACSPAIVDYFIEGRSDAFALAWFVLALWLLERKKILLSSVIFALACLSKQTIWFAVPFYGIYLLHIAPKPKQYIRAFAALIIVCLILVLPFFLWDPKAFIDSVILYLSGGGGIKYGYPVSGYGFSMVLYSMGIIKDIHGFFPFFILQAIFGLPILGLTMLWLKKQHCMSVLLFGYAFTLMAVWYFSRYFNNSHLAFVGTILLIGVTKHLDEQKYV